MKQWVRMTLKPANLLTQTQMKRLSHALVKIPQGYNNCLSTLLNIWTQITVQSTVASLFAFTYSSFCFVCVCIVEVLDTAVGLAAGTKWKSNITRPWHVNRGSFPALSHFSQHYYIFDRWIVFNILWGCKQLHNVWHRRHSEMYQEAIREKTNLAVECQKKARNLDRFLKSGWIKI